MPKTPYTNFHELNQDWIIKTIKKMFSPDNPPPYPVESVNGETGEVVLTGEDIDISAQNQTSIKAFCDALLLAIQQKYTLPSTGLPWDDLAQAVKDIINAKYNLPSGGVPWSDLSTGVKNTINNKYTLPANGIPMSQLDVNVAGLINGAIQANGSQGSNGQIPVSNGSYSVWTNPGDIPSLASAIATAVNTWLIANITNPSSPPLDRSLTQSNAAAPADLVGELFSNCPQLASVNLFDKSTATNGYFINYTNGNMQSTSVDVSASDWIPCKPNTSYTHTNGLNYQTNSVAFYNATKTFISGISTNGAHAPYTFTTPANAEYMRWTIYNAVIDSTQIEEGLTATPYSPYQKAVQLKDINIIMLKDALTKPVTVGASGCDYTSILEALISTPDSTKIIITPGIYDIAAEYTAKYGASYWTNYAGYATTNPFDRGLWVNNGRIVEMQAGAKLVFNLNGSSNVKNQFSVFATGFNATIKGGYIDIGNGLCRYAIHDDWGSSNGTNHFENIIFDGSPVSQSHIGGGMGFHLNYEILDCVFLNNTSACDISYHNNLNASAENKLVVAGCYGSKKCVFRWYGNSTKLSYCTVHDCQFSEIYAEPHPTATPNTNVNVVLVKYNNTETA